MQGYIYLIENKINGKKYVGKTVYSLKKRFAEHIKDAKKYNNRPLYRAINKYGSFNFEIKELEYCNVDLLEERERYWIDYYNTYSGEGYNATYGGSGKNLYDYDLIVEVYKNLKNATETAKTIGCSVDCVEYVLKDKEIEMLSNNIVLKNKCGKKIKAIDLKTDKVINEFNSQIEAGQWLINNNKTVITDLKKLSYVIGRAARGLDNRKHAYGYKWVFV